MIQAFLRTSSFLFFKRSAICVLLLALSGCFESHGNKKFREAEELVLEKKYDSAIEVFDRLVARYRGEEIAIKAAKAAATLSVFNLKDNKKALKYYKFLVLYSPDEEERYRSQLQMARINFEHIGDYKQAIVEYSRLVEVAKNESDKVIFRKKIAKGYFFMKNFFQAEVELSRLKKMNLSKSDRYDLLFLEGNILMTTKKIDKAIKTFSQLVDEYPRESQRDNVAIHLAICYEEKENFARAIEILDELRSEYKTPGFIEDKIKRLKLRQSLLPGAKGLRK